MYQLPRTPEFANLFSLEPVNHKAYPTSILQALLNLSPAEYKNLCYSIFHGKTVTPAQIVEYAKELDLCKSPNSPVRVYLDGAGEFFVMVYDSDDAEEFSKELEC